MYCVDLRTPVSAMLSIVTTVCLLRMSTISRGGLAHIVHRVRSMSLAEDVAFNMPILAAFDLALMLPAAPLKQGKKGSESYDDSGNANSKRNLVGLVVAASAAGAALPSDRAVDR